MTSRTSTFEAAADRSETEFGNLCDQARDLAESGHLKRAAQLYTQVLDGDSHHHRPMAALGLAVVRHTLGDIGTAREAARIAVDTGHPEYAPRAAYHLALSYEEEDAAEQAEEAWHDVLAAGNDRYTPAAHYGLARIAEGRGDPETAAGHWGRVLDGPDRGLAAQAAHDYGERLLARGDVDMAAEVIRHGLAAEDHPALRLLLGAVHVERAIGEFGAVVDASRDDEAATGEPGTAAAAVELLARLLAVRGDTEAAERAWETGLTHRDAATAADVRARLRRGFLDPHADTAAEESADRAAAGDTVAWWDPYLEAAVAQGSTPMLAGELFYAVDRMYSRLAMPLVDDETRAAALRRTLQETVRSPGEYVWGRSLHDDFRERLRRAAGSDTDVLPEGWPDHADRD
ncbi:tetratricopeptide (TPR) repeat protein [Nocardiopsis mwathae]|uniref:Tetratricopeptide (TPR) repeat protein n=1 Tax=Nocardiopsis mwathae TaxID=1472723 RepID=A0A7X0D567_9ACTN|nr:tetratricopeptide (TPR) repeat protein [Nocardiopsis mwathae]